MIDAAMSATYPVLGREAMRRMRRSPEEIVERKYRRQRNHRIPSSRTFDDAQRTNAESAYRLFACLPRGRGGLPATFIKQTVKESITRRIGQFR
jgi:hypothetical protein